MENLEKQLNQVETKADEEALAEKLREKVNKSFSFENYEKIGEYTDKIREKYPDYSEYRLWHVVISSTINENTKITHFDFPGDDSAEKFINSL